MADSGLFPREAVTAVIPAYNEAEHIGDVLHVLEQTPVLAQIIVVDDGSTDNTGAVVKAFGRRDRRIQLICLPANRGKGGALVAGANAGRHDLVMFLDADLIGLRPENVRALSEPVQQGVSGMTLGIFKNGRRQTDWSHKLTPFLSGQRCLRWSLFRDTPGLEDARWGFEVALSLYAWRKHCPVTAIPWPGVTHAMRLEKMTGLEGVWSHCKMWLDIGTYLYRHFGQTRERPSGSRRPSPQQPAPFLEMHTNRQRRLFLHPHRGPDK